MRRPSLPGAPADSRRDGTRVRLARLARGLSQQELAAAAGVTRQAVAGVEAGQWDPSLRVALALARALDQRVEELFGPPAAHPMVNATPLLTPTGIRPHRVELVQVGPKLVALPLVGDRAFRAGFFPAGGLLAEPPRPRRASWPVQSTESIRPTLVVAGCDPALPLLAAPLAHLDPPLAMSWWPCSSRQAVELAAAGVVHVAGVHVSENSDPGRGTGSANSPIGPNCEVVCFTAWAEGLAYRAGLGPLTLPEVADRRLRLVNREPGSEARALLDRELRSQGLHPDDIVGFDTTVSGHLLVGSAIAAGLGDVGVLSEPAALAYGHGFVPLAAERSLLVLPRPLLDTPELRALLRVLGSPALRAQLAALPGYRGLDSCGEVVAAW